MLRQILSQTANQTYNKGQPNTTMGHITSKTRVILYRSTLLNTNGESIHVGVAAVNLTLFKVI